MKVGEKLGFKDAETPEAKQEDALARLAGRSSAVRWHHVTGYT